MKQRRLELISFGLVYTGFFLGLIILFVKAVLDWELPNIITPAFLPAALCIVLGMVGLVMGLLWEIARSWHE